MANIKQKRKFGVSKTENCLGNTNKYVSVTKHFESNGTVNKLIDTELPEITFDINKDMSPKKRIIKFSSASKPSEIRRQLTSTCLPATRATLKKRYPSLPSKVKQIQIPKKGDKMNFTSQSFRELDMNTLTSNYNYMKFPSETDALNTSFTVNVNRQEKNKEQNGTKTVAGVVPKRSGTSLCVNRSKSLLEVYGKNDEHDTTKKLKKEIKDECMRNKRRLLAELKTEIAEFRNTKGDRDLNLGMKPPVSKSISEKINEFDSVAFILQNRVIIPNSDDFGSYPLLPKNENFEKTTQQPIETSVAEGDVSDDDDDEASLSMKTVRMRWKSLRDSYVKEIKYKMALSSGHNVKPRKNWRYSNCMTFLAPFLAISFPLTNNKQFSDESSEVIKEENEQAEQPYFIAVNSSQEEAANGHFLGALLDFSKQESPCVSAKSDDSDIDSFFKGVADTVKKFSAVNQVFIQRNIVNMVLDMKLREAHERMSHERNVSDND